MSSDPPPMPVEQQSIARLRRLYEAILDTTPDLAYVFDLDHRFIYANQGLLRMWGKSWDEAIGRTCLELGYEPWHAAMHDREIERVIATKEPIRGEVPFTGTFGRRIYDYIFTPVLDEEGKVEAVAGTTRDVTDYKQALEDLENRGRQTQALLDHAPIGNFLLDGDFRLAHVNPIAAPVLGGGELIGNDFSELVRRLLDPPTAAEVLGAFRRTLETGESHVEHEWRHHRADMNGTQYFDWQVHRIRLPDGRHGLVCYFRDVLAQVRGRLDRESLLESERAARIEADRALRVKDEFLAVLSHELRSPLSAISGWAQILATGADNGTVAKSAEVIQRNAKLLTQIITDLLDMSRFAVGKIRLEASSVDLAKIVGAAFDTFRPLAESKGIRLVPSLGEAPSTLHGDEAKLGQVVSNLLSNAIKFTPPGGVVHISLARAGPELELVVSDSGEGISPDVLPHVFDRFRQGDSSTTRRHGGLGLGLALAQQLVALHGGTIAAASEGRGKGATFTVRLPASPEPEASPTPEREHDPAAFQPASLHGVSLLVVDDDADSIQVLKRVLEDCGANVHVAYGADEALERLIQGDEDVVVCDISMPGRDGFQFLREARARGVDRPVIALTAFARPEDRDRILRAGFQAHLSKPVDVPALVGAVARASGRAVPRPPGRD